MSAVAVVAFLRTQATAQQWLIRCVVTFSGATQPVEIHLSDYAGVHPVGLLGRVTIPWIGELPHVVTVPPFGSFGFELREDLGDPY